MKGIPIRQSNCPPLSRKVGPSFMRTFLLDKCGATNSPANSSATNDQFGFTPHGYAAGKKPYGLLVLTDGGVYVNTGRVATTLDNLIAAGLIPPLVAVMVDNPHRWRELSCNSTYADFLAQEIVPWARANYHATDRPEQTIIGGTSLGGLQAACVGLKHSEVFGNVLSQSGDFKWKPDGEKEWEWVNR